MALTMGIPVSPQPSIPLENRRARTCREYSNWGGYILVLLLELSSFFNCSGGRISINGQNSEMTENQYSLAILWSKLPLANPRAWKNRAYSTWGGYILALSLEPSSIFNCLGQSISINGEIRRNPQKWKRPCDSMIEASTGKSKGTGVSRIL